MATTKWQMDVCTLGSPNPGTYFRFNRAAVDDDLAALRHPDAVIRYPSHRSGAEIYVPVRSIAFLEVRKIEVD